ncbi:hypothetical protein ACOMHN_007369 [Nucella lapillus]
MIIITIVTTIFITIIITIIITTIIITIIITTIINIITIIIITIITIIIIIITITIIIITIIIIIIIIIITDHSKQTLACCVLQRTGAKTTSATPVCPKTRIHLKYPSDNKTIYSDNYPQPYPRNLWRIWKISTHPPLRIRLTFLHFQLEKYNGKECDADRVTIFEGHDFLDPCSKLDTFCGQGVPETRSVVSKEHQMTVKFLTDYTKQGNGFVAKITAEGPDYPLTPKLFAEERHRNKRCVKFKLKCRAPSFKYKKPDYYIFFRGGKEFRRSTSCKFCVKLNTKYPGPYNYSCVAVFGQCQSNPSNEARIEQRRAFCSLQDGSEIPGYRGYIPQLKYRVGKTYGDDTSDLYKEYGYLHAAPTIGVMEPDPPPENLSIPRATGSNKYTERMVPGYTGYMPRLPFRFGNTYKQKADACIDEFTTSRDDYLAKQVELNLQTASYPRLTAISHDPVVRDHLDLYRDKHPLRQILMEDSRGKFEAPIPGYMGFIPRIGPTQIGLSKGYTRRAQQGLDTFGHDQERVFGPQADLKPSQRCRVPIPPKEGYTSGRKVWSDMVTHEPVDHRVYHRGGLIPKYTGFVPQRRFVFGETYGNTTRGLNVCSHDKNNYAAFLKTQPYPQPIVPC